LKLPNREDYEAPQTTNPLYLRTLLEELRVFGVFEALDARIDHYLKATTVDRLFALVLERLEADYEKEKPGLVRDVTALIWASRRGLSETELLELLGTPDNPMPRAFWSPLCLALEDSLVRRSGLLTFFHDFLRQAVAERYLPAPRTKDRPTLRWPTTLRDDPSTIAKWTSCPGNSVRQRSGRDSKTVSPIWTCSST